MRATIVGAGVSGLTTAIALREAGIDARIVTRETHESTVSMVAAAVWTMTAATPQESTRRWALMSRERFAALAADPTSGVVAVRQRELEREDPGPTWWETTPYVRRLEANELPAGYAAGFEIDGFVIEPPLYLPWLTRRLQSLDGTITVAEVEALHEVDGDLIVNCSGLGAIELADDDTMYPIRGQVIAVVNPGIAEGISDESDVDNIAYVYPRSREVMLGGVRQVGATDPLPDPAITRQIIERCRALDPRVAGLDVKDVRVGFRPGRDTVRVELRRLPDGRPVIHNYGHGGAGFILSWGCAGDVVTLANIER